jgi:two-component system chemotaxis response regulator CheY
VSPIRHKNKVFVIADPNAQTRGLVADVLRGGGFQNIHHCRDGKQMIERTEEFAPAVVITTSRLPEVSGLEFTRLVRAGYRSIPRTLGIIAMTDTPTKAFLEAARESGVDEMLVRPFTAESVMSRVLAVLDRPREFIDSVSYVGPCRRRRMLEDYNGPLRRFVDPIDEGNGTMPWETETNRTAVKMCVRKISELSEGLSAGDRRKLRLIFSAVKDTEAMADKVKDEMMGSAAKSLGRYLHGIGASSALDIDVVQTHIDAMYSLGVLGNEQFAERRKIVDGLETAVQKRLGRLRNLSRVAVSARL